MGAYDCIVLGLGGMGAAACWRLARRGVSVLGLDPHPLAHDRGSSHGQTRIIRQAYFEHPDYVPLLREAYRLWEELEAEASAPGSLLRRVGLLLAGSPGGAVLSGCRRSAELHGIEVQVLTHAEVGRRFPGLAAAEWMQGLFEPGAGYLRVEAAVAAMAEAARRGGAELRPGEGAQAWRVLGNGVEVRTASSVHRAGRLLICAGAWSSQFLPQLGGLLHVRRKMQLWYEAPDEPFRAVPVYGFETPAGFFYGFPKLDEAGVKVGDHSGGESVDDPSALQREARADDMQRMGGFIATHLPGAGPAVTRHSVCMYTMTPDEHFIIDRLDGEHQVCFAAGFSGHGFKFAPVVGEALADLALAGRTLLPIDFLRAGRFGVLLGGR